MHGRTTDVITIAHPEQSSGELKSLFLSARAVSICKMVEKPKVFPSTLEKMLLVIFIFTQTYLVVLAGITSPAQRVVNS